MIKLYKAAEPKVLTDNQVPWTNALAMHVAAGTKPSDYEKTRYNHPEIKAALVVETHGKCAYCESKFEHISFGDVEHIVAKRRSPDLSFRWSNLTLACDVCNTNKGDKEGLFDPYISDPQEAFIMAGPMILPRYESSEAQLTETAIKLNRPKLVERRAERIKRLHAVFVLAKQSRTPAIRQAIIDDMTENETGDDQEFAAITRAYIKSVVTS